MITSLLTRHFGFDQLRPGQEAVISRLLAGKSAAAIFPTGAGKSLCYQIPALHREGVAIVVSPGVVIARAPCAAPYSTAVCRSSLRR